jgi:hypothetical protein
LQFNLEQLHVQEENLQPEVSTGIQPKPAHAVQMHLNFHPHAEQGEDSSHSTRHGLLEVVQGL